MKLKLETLGGGVEFCPEMSCPGSVRNILSGNILSGECPEYSVRKCSVRGVSGNVLSGVVLSGECLGPKCPDMSGQLNR